MKKNLMLFIAMTSLSAAIKVCPKNKAVAIYEGKGTETKTGTFLSKAKVLEKAGTWTKISITGWVLSSQIKESKPLKARIKTNMDVVNKISQVERDSCDRPLKDVVMEEVIIERA